MFIISLFFTLSHYSFFFFFFFSSRRRHTRSYDDWSSDVCSSDLNDLGKRARRKQLPISQKESQKWLHSLDAVYTARDCCPTTHLISVGDREADIYDVLAAPRPAGVDLLLRASWNRCVNTPQRYVRATVAAQPVAAHLLLHVPGRGLQPAREATLTLRYCPLTLCPPQ